MRSGEPSFSSSRYSPYFRNTVRPCKDGVSAGQLSRLRANENVSTHTLDMLCQILDCRLEDIAMFTKDR
ncbi:MAG: helix-turn-helix transcriptional regulator [Lachnospiraceae bacterium]|nr:helix-turn-helix transcriptional regulator [Lachnospiraceae bacterium]